MKVLGAVIAGGQSRRMGGEEKAFLALGGVVLIERVMSRIAPQVDSVVINANGDPVRFSLMDCPVIADTMACGTPLAGLHAVLSHGRANGFDAVLTVPSDSPFLPLNLVARLLDAGARTGAAVGSSGGQTHHLTGLWSTAMAGKLEELLLARKLRRMMDLADVFEIAVADWDTEPVDPFLNINTPEDLALAAVHLV
jgi:molybdopterin-guanine dinucleotide biosynthesis protein A